MLVAAEGLVASRFKHFDGSSGKCRWAAISPTRAMIPADYVDERPMDGTGVTRCLKFEKTFSPPCQSPIDTSTEQNTCCANLHWMILTPHILLHRPYAVNQLNKPLYFPVFGSALISSP